MALILWFQATVPRDQDQAVKSVVVVENLTIV